MSEVMSYSGRCPYCDRIIAAASRDRESFRGMVLAHFVKCGRLPVAITFPEAATAADVIVSRAERPAEH